MVLSEDQGNFKFGKTILPDEAKTKIDEMVSQIKQDPKNIYLEIERRTDNVGAAKTNEQIGLARRSGEEVLYDRAQIPLHKMNVISYGRTSRSRRTRPRPVAPRTVASSSRCSRRKLPRSLGKRPPAERHAAGPAPPGHFSSPQPPASTPQPSFCPMVSSVSLVSNHPHDSSRALAASSQQRCARRRGPAAVGGTRQHLAMSLETGGQLRFVVDNHVHGAAVLREHHHQVVEHDVVVTSVPNAPGSLSADAEAGGGREHQRRIRMEARGRANYC